MRSIKNLMNDIPISNNNYSIIKYIRFLYITHFIFNLIIFKLLSREIISFKILFSDSILATTNVVKLVLLEFLSFLQRKILLI